MLLLNSHIFRVIQCALQRRFAGYRGLLGVLPKVRTRDKVLSTKVARRACPGVRQGNIPPIIAIMTTMCTQQIQHVAILQLAIFQNQCPSSKEVMKCSVHSLQKLLRREEVGRRVFLGLFTACPKI